MYVTPNLLKEVIAWAEILSDMFPELTVFYFECGEVYTYVTGVIIEEFYINNVE